MPEIAFVMSAGQDWHLQELAETLASELERQDVPCAIHRSGFPAPREGQVQLLVDPDSFLELEGEAALPDAATLARTIFLSTARPGPPGEDRLRLLRRAGAVFDIHPRAVLHLRRAGIAARLLKPGYTEHLDRFDAEVERPVDVLFLGSHSQRRADLLAGLAPVLARFNCLLSLAPQGRHPSTSSSSYLGPAKWDLLRASKVVLNLHHGEEHSFEWWRAMDAIHAGAVLVSEPAVGLAPLVAGEHLLVADPGALPFVLESVLADPERLAGLRRAAYERASQWMPLAMGIGVLRAAAVELVGAPLSLSPEETAEQPEADPEADALEAAVERSRRDLDAARGELAAVRRELGRVERRLASRIESHRERTGWLDSPAWSARRAPRTSVLVALAGGAEAIRTLLTGVDCQRDGSLEIIAVDAGAESGGLDAASAWIRARPRVASRLLATGTGLDAAGAVAVALAQARARACLILDPGTDLYPRALEVLGGTLDALEDVDYVYPMVELRDPDADRPELANCLGWEPGSAPLAPLLVRSAVLRELGGSVSALLREGRGQLVSQILATRTDSQLALT